MVTEKSAVIDRFALGNKFTYKNLNKQIKPNEKESKTGENVP